jgi:hypothetical protein
VVVGQVKKNECHGYIPLGDAGQLRLLMAEDSEGICGGVEAAAP